MGLARGLDAVDEDDRLAVHVVDGERHRVPAVRAQVPGGPTACWHIRICIRIRICICIRIRIHIVCIYVYVNVM